MSEATRQMVEKRRILDSDIQQVIAHAADHGQLFYDTKSKNYLASLQLGQVTFWVQYGPGKNGGYDIYTAYSHRMAIGTVNAEKNA